MTSPSIRTVLPMLAALAGMGYAVWRFEQAAPPAPLGLVTLGLSWLLAFVAASAGLGSPLLRWVEGRRPDSLETWTLALAAGAGVLATAAWMLSLVGMLRPLPLLLLFLLAAGAGTWQLREHVHPERPMTGWPLTTVLLVSTIGAITFLTALTLAPHYDQWHQHLGFASQWLRQGRLEVMPRNLYSYMPATMSLLYTYALAGLGPWAAQVMHWAMGALSVAAVVGVGHRCGGRDAGRWGATILVATPTIAALATTGMSDLAIAGWSAASWLAILRAAEPGKGPGFRRWALAGIMIGLAAGTKYVALATVAMPVGFGAILLLARGCGLSPRAAVARMAVLVVSSAAVFSPWAVRNLVATGNPLYPYQAGLFGALSDRDQGEAAAVARWIGDYDPSWANLRAGLDLAAFSSPGDGFTPTGGLILGLGPAALVLLITGRLGREGTAVAAGALVGLAAWVPGLHCARYLAGALVPTAAILGVTAAWLLASWGRLVRTGILAVLAVLVAANLVVSLSPHGLQRLGVTLGQVPYDDVMARWVSHWGAVQFVNHNLPADARLLLVAEARALLVDRDVELEDGFGPPLLVELAESSPDDGEIAEALHRRGITHLLVNRQEARRMAAMAGRDDYFATSSPAAAARLDRFLATRLEPLWEEHGIGVYRLR